MANIPTVFLKTNSGCWLCRIKQLLISKQKTSFCKLANWLCFGVYPKDYWARKGLCWHVPALYWEDSRFRRLLYTYWRPSSLSAWSKGDIEIDSYGSSRPHAWMLLDETSSAQFWVLWVLWWTPAQTQIEMILKFLPWQTSHKSPATTITTFRYWVSQISIFLSLTKHNTNALVQVGGSSHAPTITI